LRRKYMGEITSDPATFAACTDTIVRQVGDIGRLVDEFSSFARMPAPVMKREDLAEICDASKVLFENAHRDITFKNDMLDTPIELVCDRHQVGQALTNLMQNAVDAINGREIDSDTPGEVGIEVTGEEGYTIVSIFDNGIGLPVSERDRLTEPYVTTRDKGTGLGLAIVRKIMEDHGGTIRLDDSDSGGARVSLVFSNALENSDSEVKGANKVGKRIVTHGT